MGEKAPSEQLEEGEIVDDDFEDISDNSISDPSFGKFVSSNEHLRALPLSSDSEIDKKIKILKTRKLLHRKSKTRYQRRRKKRRVSSDSSDSDLCPSRAIKCKLKEAIHISGIDGGIKNPLETRLKAMGGLSNKSDPPQAQTSPKNNEDSSDKIDDTELENLRMEALKTAILNKCQRRKRKKASPEKESATKTLENKENDTPKDEQKSTGKTTENPVIDLDEDEDILRASLLAGLAKNITKKQIPDEISVIKPKVGPPQLPIQVKTVLPKRPITSLKINNVKTKLQKITVNKPQVKPLIINVNDDSDSDEEVKPKPPKIIPTQQKKQDLNLITNNVEKFLKEQRAKFESDSKKKFHIVNDKKDKSILERSAVKLLPKSQQIEYQLLLKRLRNAEKRKKAQKIVTQKLKNAEKKTAKVAENVISVQSAPAPSVEVVVTQEAVQVEVKPQEEASKSENSAESEEKRRSDIISELTVLKKTLKEIKMQKNGSLQIKSKYQALTPIIRKITATSNDRKKQEQRIKILLRELSEARNNLAKSHERFSTLVKDLVNSKEKIDKSHEENKNLDRKKENGNLATDSNKKDITSAPVTSTPIKANVEVADEASISFVSSSTNNDCEDMDVCNSDETDICQIDIVDPNDIDQIFQRKTQVKSAFPEYVSPLCFNTYQRYSHVDPLGIMCPYEVNGSCRDVDCTYKHYLKNN